MILTINAGSSNIKAALFDAKSLKLIAKTKLFSADEITKWLPKTAEIIAVGYRVVHGGAKYFKPTRIDKKLVAELKKLQKLAPLHLPLDIALIEKFQKLYPKLPHIACFDTGFHESANPLDKLFPLPLEYAKKGVRRYGFHGLSYEYIASVLPKFIKDAKSKKIVVAHLGSGASACVLKSLKSYATTMGFSALDGLMMSSRTGRIDAGVLLYMLTEEKKSAAEISEILYKKSGLLGASGISGDVQVLEKSESPNAKQALDLFCYSAAKEIGGLAAILGGIDALVFTGGIGENSKLVRDKISAYVKNLGKVEVAVIPTNEEYIIASAAKKFLSAK